MVISTMKNNHKKEKEKLLHKLAQYKISKFIKRDDFIQARLIFKK